jgi:hypothetical protein
VHYPILPEVVKPAPDAAMSDVEQEILHIRHHSLFTPRDFDISPYFQIVKPMLKHGFDCHQLVWDESAPP